ncbi:hypothetical protein QOZ80_2BG0188520 [Eleusine coracana subsp. coracana]|nr:hypothetical protein QOZ80_2BG0188520 [Eleusine coracana subsp. coracana]
MADAPAHADDSGPHLDAERHRKASSWTAAAHRWRASAWASVLSLWPRRRRASPPTAAAPSSNGVPNSPSSAAAPATNADPNSKAAGSNSVSRVRRGPPVTTSPLAAALNELMKAPPPGLETYGRDMTAAAGEADPVIGRDAEIDRVVCILCRRTKNNAVLVGAPGVGKTAIAEGLAQRIAAGAVPPALVGARVVEIDAGALVASTTLRGMFEERVKRVVREAEEADGKVVLFIDEMHMLLGAGKGLGSTMDGANLLKPALARGRVRCVGATTFVEYSKYIEKDAALERRFQKVIVEEPSLLATVAILHGLKKKYESHHGVTIQDAAVVAAARLANRYITSRQFPDKAIDLMDEACAITRMQTVNQLKGDNTQHTLRNVVEKAIVCPDQIAQVVSRLTGIPVNTIDQDEKEKLMHLTDRLQERVVGQQEAVTLVAQAVLRSRAGLNQPNKPIGSFLFLGSTGVGKTELAKALAEQLFDSEKMLIRFDMTEFVGSHSIMRLIGAPPSYLGHEDGGQLTEKVRQRPYSVILF